MGKSKVSITTTAVNFAVMFKAPSDTQDEVYVMTVVDPVNQIFTGIRVAGKISFNFPPTATVIVLDDIPGFPPPSVGPVLLAL